MSYSTSRRAEIKHEYLRNIKRFASAYDRSKETVVLLPGGMGSQLERSVKTYVDDSSLPFRTYNPVWIDLGLLFAGDTLKLEILTSSRDKGNHIIVPEGPLRFFVTAYDGTERYFRDHGYNYIVFPYDWRRSLDESGSYLIYFLERLKTEVQARKGHDPLPSTSLVCHSMGGLVVLRFLQRLRIKSGFRPEHIIKWLKRIVTVATPFYGTSTHMKRYYKGEKLLSILHGEKKVARVAASFEGPYILSYLNQRAYELYKAAFDRRGEPPELPRYPVRDAADPDNRIADPSDSAMIGRYPPWVSARYLSNTRSLWTTLSRRLPKAFQDRIYHIRADKQVMWTEQRWKDIDGSSYDPSSQRTPLSGVSGPGDGTVPFWSARLAQTPDSQVYSASNNIMHSELMEHDEVLDAIDSIIQSGNCPTPTTRRKDFLGQKKASAKRATDYVRDVQSGKATLDDERATDPQLWRRILEETTLC